MITLDYEFIEEDKKSNPIKIINLKPIQTPHVDIEELRTNREKFN